MKVEYNIENAVIEKAMIRNFDYDKFYEWCNSKGITPNDVSEKLGFNRSFFANCKLRNALKPNVYKMFLLIYDLPDCAFLKTDIVSESNADNTPATDDSSSDTLKELKDLNVSVNRLGNIMMQMLEYLKDIRDEVK